MTGAATARLFVAVDPPLGVREQLLAWAREALRGLGARGSGPVSVRVLDPELLHLTLCFLGDRPVDEIAAIAGALGGCAGPVGELSIGAPLWLPPRRPRSLAVEVHDDPHGGLEALRGALVGALAEVCGSGEDEHRRRFRAHVTLARLRAGSGRGASEQGSLGERALPATPALSFKPEEIVLYRSWLAPAGASYEALAVQPV
ncbi:MAG TPA: RNA 2',3'-cyclic phosphodiesterase [Solirubrobacteraceae bacterium]|nr:RNA 2',3'-cyclic phosphodiesterase [Solirubrobacteraceae bacterium]